MVQLMTKEFKDEMLEETKGMLHPDLNVPKSIERAAKLAVEVQNGKVALLNNLGDETLQERFYDDWQSAVTALGLASHEAMGECQKGRYGHKCQDWIAKGGAVISLMFKCTGPL